MAGVLEVLGVKEATAKLLKTLSDLDRAQLAGFYRAGLLIQRLAQQRVPVEYGNLRGSAYTQRVGKEVEIGFTAIYAPYVHENMQMKLKGKPRPSGLGNYWGPKGQPKFLESALNDTKVDAIVAAELKKVLSK